MLNKSRLENLSDGLFAIVLTLLVLEIHIPEIEGANNAAFIELLRQISLPLVEFFLSFIVLTMFWIGHNFMYAVFAKTINRRLIVLNLLYLAFISLIPLSATVLATYREIPLAVALYGLNVFLIGALNIAVFEYALRSHEIESGEVSGRIIKQARIRQFITPFLTAVGIVAAFYSTPVAYILYALPIIFNVLPGSLNALERIFGFELK